VRKLKVLLVSHNHPAIRPGGAERYAFELYEAMRDSGDFEPVFLARSGPPDSATGRYHDGTFLAAAGDDPNQYLLFTDPSDYDWFYGRSKSKALGGSLRDLLLAHRPDVIHFQHTVRVGYEAIRLCRNILPDVPIVYTLHEFRPICNRSGQMVRTGTEALCTESSPRRCHECFPEISPQSFFMRKRFIHSHLELVDQFLSPTEFLLERYVEWGIPREKLRFEPHGRPAPLGLTTRENRNLRNRFGFFGTLNAFKGPQILLEALNILGESFEGHVWIHGSSLELQSESFQQRMKDLLLSVDTRVTFAGGFDHDQLGGLIGNVGWVVVPSIWWENSPLVIDEAFMHERPVICSDIGGMAERVTDGTSGLHFQRGSPDSLAEVMSRAASELGLWEDLRSGIPAVHDMAKHLETLREIYDAHITRRWSKLPEGGRTTAAVTGRVGVDHAPT
jgi:glycosyltransferase involved in cell wall biosynthesis